MATQADTEDVIAALNGCMHVTNDTSLSAGPLQMALQNMHPHAYAMGEQTMCESTYKISRRHANFNRMDA